MKATKSMKFSYNPITISGTLQLLADDPMGIYHGWLMQRWKE
ncbi:MAG: hypothetical protein R3C41_21025 [Calditrichia bacterium]